MNTTFARERPQVYTILKFRKVVVFAALFAGALGAAYGAVAPPGAAAAGPPGMVWVPGGEFTMGTDSAPGQPDERPAHRVRVSGFWMDATDVTNAQFRAFVEATGYVTTA